MKLTCLAGAFALTLTASGAFAQDNASVASPIDKVFAGNASISNTFEIRSSELALQKSRDPVIIGMARWMIHDHTMAERQLQAATRYANSDHDAAPAVDDMTEGMLNQLGTLDGSAFDEAYVADQVTAHRMTAVKLTDYRQAGSYGPLLAWDAKTAPAVDEHLEHFEMLSK